MEHCNSEPPCIAIVGGGLAGSECALFLARHGLNVTLFEQKPDQHSPAHTSPKMAELICSNSLRSDDLASGIGLLKQEMRELGSPLMAFADATRVPAGKALAVDRDAFSTAVDDAVTSHPHITVVRTSVESLDDPVIAVKGTSAKGFDNVVIAAGPLASDGLSASISSAVGANHLYFYDAIAPIVSYESIDMDTAFWCSRYGEPGEGDYLNCPLDKDQYLAFHAALCQADQAPGHDFEKEIHFEGCMPIEALAARGERTLAFGPMKPVGITDPKTGHRPYAVLQLRPENANKTMFNLVGCQTKMTYPAQDIVFRMVPGLEHAEFVRHGSMHRNTYVNAPVALTERLELINRPGVRLAGQITGVEGYVESMACGLWAGMCIIAELKPAELPLPPTTCALGALLGHLRLPAKNFQPSNAHFGLMPEPDVRLKKKDRKTWYMERARTDFSAWLELINTIL